MKHRMLVIMVLGLVAHVSCAKKRLFFGDYSSSESSESSNSTESDDWLGPLFSIFGPIQTTTKRPAAAGTKIPITTTTLRPPIIKCSDKPTEPCPTDCMTDSAIIHGFCCNCKNPSDLKMKPAYLCPASTACPSDTTKLCDLFSRLMTCCCHDAFTPKPPTNPPSKPVGSPPGRPSPTPPMTGTTQKPASTEAWPTPPPRPSQTTQKPSSTDPWPTPPTRPSPTSATTPVTTSATTPSPSSATTPLPTSATTSSPSSQPPEASPIPTPPTTSAPTSPKPSDESSTPSSSTSVTSTSVPPAPLPTTAGPPQSPSGDSPSSGKSQQHHIVVDIDSGSVHDEEIDLPFETVARRAPRKRRHISSF